MVAGAVAGELIICLLAYSSAEQRNMSFESEILCQNPYVMHTLPW